MLTDDGKEGDDNNEVPNVGISKRKQTRESWCIIDVISMSYLGFILYLKVYYLNGYDIICMDVRMICLDVDIATLKIRLSVTLTAVTR